MSDLYIQSANEYECSDVPPPYTPSFNLRLVLHQDVETAEAPAVVNEQTAPEQTARTPPEPNAYAELTGLWSQIFKELGDTWTELSTGFGKGMEEFKNDLLTAKQDVSHGLSGAKLGVSQAVNDTRDGLSKAMLEARDELARAVNEARSEWSNAVSSALGVSEGSAISPLTSSPSAPPPGQHPKEETPEMW